MRMTFATRERSVGAASAAAVSDVISPSFSSAEGNKWRASSRHFYHAYSTGFLPRHVEGACVRSDVLEYPLFRSFFVRPFRLTEMSQVKCRTMCSGKERVFGQAASSRIAARAFSATGVTSSMLCVERSCREACRKISCSESPVPRNRNHQLCAQRNTLDIKTCFAILYSEA